MKKSKPTNKAISDSITGLLQNGIDVNVNIKTQVLIRLTIFALVLTALISATSYGMHVLKKG